LPYNRAEASKTIEVAEAVPIEWWLLALAGAVGGIIVISGAITSAEWRKAKWSR
jgi:hypothetical protein